ncbi:MAG: hypothetical protein WDN03_03815 [Rhizomicrobium sp.]
MVVKLQLDATETFDDTFKPAMARVDFVIRDTASELQDQLRLEGLTNAAVMVGIGGAGIAGLFHGSRDLVTGFATVGAAGFAVNNLYGSKAYELIYMEGLRTLYCVRGKAVGLAKTFEPARDAEQDVATAATAVQAGLDAVDAARNRAQGIADAEADPPKAAHQAALAATVGDARILAARDGLSSATASYAAATTRTDQEVRYAAATQQAVDSIVGEVNQQILTIRPSAADIAAAAGGISASAQSTAAADIPKPAAAPAGAAAGMAAAPPPHAATYDAAKAALDNALADLDLATKALLAATQKLDTIVAKIPEAEDTVFSNCAMADKTKGPPLTTDAPNPLALAAGQTMRYGINGGGGLMRHAEWSGVTPKNITASVVNSTVVEIVADTAGWTAGQSYTLKVYETGAGAGAPATIAITTK